MLEFGVCHVGRPKASDARCKLGMFFADFEGEFCAINLKINSINGKINQLLVAESMINISLRIYSRMCCGFEQETLQFCRYGKSKENCNNILQQYMQEVTLFLPS